MYENERKGLQKYNLQICPNHIPVCLTQGCQFVVIIPPWKRAGPFIWTNLNPIHPRILCAKFGWNWPSGSGEDFSNSSMYFNYFVITYLPLVRGLALHLNKLESPLPRNALCQVWLKLAQWFWRRNFQKFVIVFSQFRNYLPLEKGRALHLDKLASP